MKRITDKSFVYTPSYATDISKTFKRITAEQKKAEKPSHVVPMKRKEASK